MTRRRKGRGRKRHPETDERGSVETEEGAERAESIKGAAKWDTSLKMGRILEGKCFESRKVERKEIFLRRRRRKQPRRGPACKQSEFRGPGRMKKGVSDLEAGGRYSNSGEK